MGISQQQPIAQWYNLGFRKGFTFNGHLPQTLLSLRKSGLQSKLEGMASSKPMAFDKGGGTALLTTKSYWFLFC